MMIKCPKCNTEKSPDEYYKNKNTKCKKCYKKYYELNKEKIVAKRKEYRINNPEKYKERVKKNCRERYLKNPEKFIERRRQASRKHYSLNKEKAAVAAKKYRERDPEKHKEQAKKSYQKNKKKRKDYYLNKRKNNELFKLISNLRVRLHSFFNHKSKPTKEIIGCSLEELKKHLSDKFKDRYKKNFDWTFYTESNQYYGWHIDHIIPLSSAKSEEEAYRLCHYTNLEFLWWEENLSKGNTIINEEN